MALDKDTAEKFINQFWPTAFYTETRPVDFGTLYGFFVQDGDRYAFDFGCKKDWYQVDNDQDSWYFGQWCNPATLQNLSYVEGDIYLVQNKSKAGYLEDIKRMGQVDDHNQQHDEILRCDL